MILTAAMPNVGYSEDCFFVDCGEEGDRSGLKPERKASVNLGGLFFISRTALRS